MRIKQRLIKKEKDTDMAIKCTLGSFRLIESAFEKFTKRILVPLLHNLLFQIELVTWRFCRIIIHLLFDVRQELPIESDNNTFLSMFASGSTYITVEVNR